MQIFFFFTIIAKNIAVLVLIMLYDSIVFNKNELFCLFSFDYCLTCVFIFYDGV